MYDILIYIEYINDHQVNYLEFYNVYKSPQAKILPGRKLINPTIKMNTENWKFSQFSQVRKHYII